jgi:hypothetical protein
MEWPVKKGVWAFTTLVAHRHVIVLRKWNGKGGRMCELLEQVTEDRRLSMFVTAQ